jgi:undecaprenyl-diphosphatase
LVVSSLPLFALFLPIPKFGNVKGFAESLTTGSNIKFVGFAMIATGLMLSACVFVSKNANKQIGKMTAGDAFCVGVSQFFAAVFPGLSRSGSTLSVGVFRGTERQSALDFSFMMGIPAIVAATVLEFREIYSSKVRIDKMPMIAGILTSMIVGFFSIKILRWVVKSNGTWIFAVYTLVLGAVLILF